MIIRLTFLLFFFLMTSIQAQEIAILHYNGGGDWYSNPTALPNLIEYSNRTIQTAIDPKPKVVTPDSPDIFQYPFIHMTGHGNVVFNEAEIENLRNYLFSGGFIHIDDNYGMEPYIRKELGKIFPEYELKELPISHSIYASPYELPEGLPKIHEHDGKQPLALGIFHEDRLVILLTLESDLGDGWESPEVHNDPEPVRIKALKMGTNIINYAFNH